MDLNQQTNYFIAVSDAVLRDTPDSSGEAINHMIYGDWLRWLGDSDGDWEKVQCRGDIGWVKKNEFGTERVLEVNFVDIGQGDGTHIVFPDDKVMLVDAGKTNNMERFLSWRYNLRDRDVAGVDGISEDEPDAEPPFGIAYAVISHPDLDHYQGFSALFANPKLRIGTIYHNGIVERPVSQEEKDALDDAPELRMFHDLGVALDANNGERYLLNTIDSDETMRELIDKHSSTRKKYLSTLRSAIKNPANMDTKFHSLSSEDHFIPGFEDTEQVCMPLLGPVRESIEVKNENLSLLRILGSEGVTKNGHSLVFQLRIGQLKIMLGGDLNTESEDFLIRHYCNSNEDVSALEDIILKAEAKGDKLTAQQQQSLTEARTALNDIVTQARPVFQVDITKAHHHGSHHFSESFLKALNAIAIVVSSGDAEAYSHPRPDALGAFGKYGRGHRPLIFSTEIARSTNEFTSIFQFYDRIKQYENDIANATTNREKARLTKEIQNEKDRNVAVYGMITLRTNGEKVFIAQKIEQPTKLSQKWDIHELIFNEDRDEFVYVDKTHKH